MRRGVSMASSGMTIYHSGRKSARGREEGRQVRVIASSTVIERNGRSSKGMMKPDSITHSIAITHQRWDGSRVLILRIIKRCTTLVIHSHGMLTLTSTTIRLVGPILMVKDGLVTFGRR